MNRHLLYAYSQVGKGWWPIIDKYISAILELDPECQFEPKEKFGELRLQAFCSTNCELDKRKEIWRLQEEAEDASMTVCEYCGKAGRLRTEKRSWYLTLCDECDALDKDGEYYLYLEERMLLGQKHEQLIGLVRREELWKQWGAFPAKNTLQNDEYKVWYRGLTWEEQGAVIGWNAEVEAHVRSEM